MGGQLKGRVALAGLLLVLVVFGVALAVTPAARVRYWAWRARSSDRSVRLAARTRLMEIGRPAIDAVFPELVAGEAVDCLASVPKGERVAFVGQVDGNGFTRLEGSNKLWPRFVVERALAIPPDADQLLIAQAEWSDRVAESLSRGLERKQRMLVIGQCPDPAGCFMGLLLVQLPETDPIAPAVIEETKARLEIGRQVAGRVHTTDGLVREVVGLLHPTDGLVREVVGLPHPTDGLVREVLGLVHPTDGLLHLHVHLPG